MDINSINSELTEVTFATDPSRSHPSNHTPDSSRGRKVSGGSEAKCVFHVLCPEKHPVWNSMLAMMTWHWQR